jgi:hypothetical protein
MRSQLEKEKARPKPGKTSLWAREEENSCYGAIFAPAPYYSLSLHAKKKAHADSQNLQFSGRLSPRDKVAGIE